ncbi:MAG TPA: hypothetical protein IAC14_11045 [Candidatus Scybalomonas excrementigallinarum]|nr:hypothetical protein [Candidatus Scybalomonas excrementigallinarum]
MKLVDYGILFWALVATLLLPLQLAQREWIVYGQYERQYHKKMDNAIDDALFYMVEQDDFKNIKINREECVDAFYRSFYGNFGFMRNPMGQKRIKQHLPMISVIELNRMSIAYRKPVQKEGEWQLEEYWSPYYSYQYEENGYQYEFSVGNLSDWVRIYSLEKKEWVEGLRFDLVNKNKDFSWMRDDESFEQIRRHTVIETIKKKMQEVINRYNLIGIQYGKQYEFYLPEIETQPWCRTLDDMGIIVLFQGYPVDSLMGDTYDRFLYAGARTYKQEKEIEIIKEE